MFNFFLSFLCISPRSHRPPSTPSTSDRHPGTTVHTAPTVDLSLGLFFYHSISPPLSPVDDAPTLAASNLSHDINTKTWEKPHCCAADTLPEVSRAVLHIIESDALDDCGMTLPLIVTVLFSIWSQIAGRHTYSLRVPTNQTLYYCALYCCAFHCHVLHCYACHCCAFLQAFHCCAWGIRQSAATGLHSEIIWS